MLKILNYKIIVATALIFTLLSVPGYSLIEPIFVSAQSDSDTVQVTLIVDAEITISTENDVTMSPNISFSNDTSSASTTWTVATNDPGGYSIELSAATTPAMQSGSNSFADYTPGTPGTPDDWSVTNAFEFGFSAYGAHVPTGTWGSNTTSCGNGGPELTNRKYNGFNGATGIQVANHSATTSTSGVPTTVCFAAEQKDVLAPSGTYTANITATATVN